MKMVEFFIDSSDIEEIKKWAFLVKGCTTNPKILSSDNVENIEDRIRDIGHFIEGPISVEVLSDKLEEMLKEAEHYSFWHSNVIIKIPVLNYDSLRAIKELEKRNIKVNATGCISMNQAIMAAMAGASYISFFYGRIGDEGGNPEEIIKQTSNILRSDPTLKKTKIIVGSIRSILDINRSIASGADVITITPDIMKKLMINAQTEKAIKEFNESFEKLQKEFKKLPKEEIEEFLHNFTPEEIEYIRGQ
jgi:transaldolase